MVILLGLLIFCCAAAPVPHEKAQPTEPRVGEHMAKALSYPLDAYDPLEPVNRRIYKFNALFDKYVFLPVVRAYEFVLPVPVQDMVSNFFNNVHEVKTLANSLLQLKGRQFSITLSRMVVNTTLGLGGLFDPATGCGLPKQNEDFGQTLGFYGLGAGPYIVLPIFGPSSVRDTGGFVFDWVTYDRMVSRLVNELDLSTADEDNLKRLLTLIDAVDTRHQQSFRYYETGSPFEYELIRGLYLRSRELLIEN
jgi:phospholipid-binding lipoprotein MlaA